MIVPVLGYAPDADPSIIGVITNCSAVVPSIRGVKGAPSAVASGMATLAATCTGSAVITKLDGTNRLFAGTATKIYEAGASTWTDVSAAITYTGTAATSRWRYAQQGNVTLAVNGADSVQASVSTGNFTTLPSTPIASIVEVVNQFVLVFNTSTNTSGWQCSALGDYTLWTTSIATQATSGTLTSSPGPITAGRRFGDAVVVYKRDSMFLGVYVGPPTVWNFQQIPGKVGANSQECVVNVGTADNPVHLYMGDDDFYKYDGSKPVPIGSNRVKETVFGAFLRSRYYACTALHDRQNSRVYFYYPTIDSAQPDKCVVYNYHTDKWGVDDRQIEAATDYVAAAITYDGLGAVYATYDALPNLAYDQAFIAISKPIPAVFDTSHVLKTLNGVATTTSFTTGDLGDQTQFNTLNRIRPKFLTAPTSATMTNYYRNNIGDALTADATTALSSGTFDVIRDARWHRLMFTMVGDWEMPGFTPEYAESGLE